MKILIKGHKNNNNAKSSLVSPTKNSNWGVKRATNLGSKTMKTKDFKKQIFNKNRNFKTDCK